MPGQVRFHSFVLLFHPEECMSNFLLLEIDLGGAGFDR